MVDSMNTIKIILFTFLGAVLCFNCASDAAPSAKENEKNNTKTAFTKTIPPADFLETYRATPGAIMVDVRTSKEYYGGRMIPEAINVDYHGDNFLTDIVTQDRSQPIFVYCYSGGRSSKAAFKMRQLGFDRIYECAGGYQQWEKEKIK